MKMKLKFEDLHAHNPSTYYLVPNEDTMVWRSLVKGLRVDRAAAICSSGEVGLIAMLPTVRKELVLLDHSYASLSVAMLKFIMLRELGAAKTRELLVGKDAVALRENLDKFVQTLPEKVQEAYAKRVQRGGDDFTRNYNARYDYTHIDPATGLYKIVDDGGVHSTNTGLVREWERLPKRDLYTCAKKLDRVTFLHGDLSDLADKGPFDLLYLSNALHHESRKGGHPKLDEIGACLAPGGHVIVAHYSHRDIDYYGTEKQLNNSGWEKVKSVPGQRGLSWTHTLFRVPAKKEEVAA